MQDMLKTGLAFLTTKLATHAARTVVYGTDAGNVSVRATFGSSRVEISNGDGSITVQWTDLSIVVPTADLVLDGVPITPVKGHRVYVTGDDGNTKSYEVGPYTGDAAYKFTDPHGSQIRIHTKRVRNELSRVLGSGSDGLRFAGGGYWLLVLP